MKALVSGGTGFSSAINYAIDVRGRQLEKSSEAE